MLTYAVGLLILGIALVILEAFIPSGGMLGILAAAALVGALVLAFQQDDSTGFVFLAVIMVSIPVVIIMGLKMLPKTPFGRKLILRTASRLTPAKAATAMPVGASEYGLLLNKTGVTVSPLRPSGVIEIGERRYSAIAECEMIETDRPIRIIRIDGNSIVVDEIKD